MTREVDSDALGIVNRALGIAGAGAPLTEFSDGILDQVLSVNDLVRRGRTPAESSGLFYGVLQTVHPGADTQTTEINPFNAAVGAIEPYPVPVPIGFDLWLVAANLQQTAAVVQATAGLFTLLPATSQGWGLDEGNLAVVTQVRTCVAFWDSLVQQTHVFGITEQGEPLVKIGQRLRPGTTLLLSVTSAAAATYNCQCIMGLFPVGMGQDVFA